MTDQEICGACDGSRRMPRDPDIGTDQECFVCDGSGVIAAHEQAAPAVLRGFATLNEWFLSLPDQRQAQLRDDKWMLAGAAFEAGQASAPAVPGGEAVAKFIEQANSLLTLDAKNALAPHGIGGFARQLLTEAIRLLSAPSQPVTLTDEYAGVIAWIGDKQCKRVLTEGAIKKEHTPGVAMRNTAHQCVQEVIIAALREKEGK